MLTKPIVILDDGYSLNYIKNLLLIQHHLLLQEGQQRALPHRHQEELQRRPRLLLPLQAHRGPAELLQRARGGVREGQLRRHLRAPRRDDGQRLPVTLH